ncbi:hypothetical protein C8R46DRAFT_30585 [Mycena filopes]|nr:hypothetical protein C8R46DRAFT_30585 [Mycena filopes]
MWGRASTKTHAKEAFSKCKHWLVHHAGSFKNYLSVAASAIHINAVVDLHLGRVFWFVFGVIFVIGFFVGFVFSQDCDLYCCEL